MPHPNQVKKVLPFQKHCENIFISHVVDKVSNCMVTFLGTIQAISDYFAQLKCNWIQLFYSPQNVYTMRTVVKGSLNL